MEYFDHNVNASDDDAIMALRLEHGGAAVDCYWALMEKIYREERPLCISETNAETKSVSHRLAIGFESLSEYVKSMISLGLLVTDENDPECVFSVRAMENIERYHQKCETARQNARKGGRKPKQKPTGKPDANQTQTAREPNKTKQNKSIGAYKNAPNTFGKPSDSVLEEAETGDSQTQGTCPDCGSVTYRKTTRSGSVTWYCPRCHESKKDPIGEGTACPDELRKAVLS